MTETAANLALAFTGGTLSGTAIGFLYFALLRRTVAFFASGARVRVPLLLTVLRFCAAIGVFWLLAQWGAAAAIGGVVGFSAVQLRAVLSARAT